MGCGQSQQAVAEERPVSKRLKLHYYKLSQPSRAVAWFVNTHKLPVDFVDIDMMKGETQSPDFTAKNPFQAVPVLELEDGTFMNESGAILYYLAKKYDVKSEIPTSFEALAQMLSALLNNTDLSRHVTLGLVRPCLPKLANPAMPWDDITKAIAANETELLWTINILEAKLRQHPFIAGDSWALADYNVAAELSQWPIVNSILPGPLKIENFPSIKKYLDVASQRPGWQDFVAPLNAFVGMLQLPQQ